MRTSLRAYAAEVFDVPADATVREIADQMDIHSVGCLLVVDDADAPLGVITDRDLLRRVVAAGRDPEKTTARDVMTSELVTATAGEPLARAIERMREHGIRRLPVLEGGRAVAMLSLDDVLQSLSGDLWNLSEALRIELRETRRTTWRRRMREQRDEAVEELWTQASQLGREARQFLRAELSNLLESLKRGGA
jgi:CBS domain-containing protein